MAIGPRLMLFITVPTVALISLIGLLVWTDAQSLLELRQFRADTEDVSDLVGARAQIQAERHLLLDGDPTTPAQTGGNPNDEFEQSVRDKLNDLDSSTDLQTDLTAAPTAHKRSKI